MKYLAFVIGVLVSTGAFAGKYQPDSFAGFEVKKAKKAVVKKNNNLSRSQVAQRNETLHKIVLNPVFIRAVAGGAAGKVDEVETLVSASSATLEIPAAYVRSAELLALTYDIENYAFLGPLEPAIFVWLTAKDADKIKTDERISSISEVEAENDIKMSESNPPNISGDVNLGAGNEKISWGVEEVAASGAVNNQYNNTVYVVDASPKGMHPGASNDLNFAFVKDSVYSAHDLYDNDQKYHVAHVMGIIGAKQNSSNVVGVNPNQPIMLVGATTWSTTDNSPDPLIPETEWYSSRANVELGMDFAAIDAEQRNLFSVVNVSFNGPEFNYFSDVGMAARRASNRLLVVESAGNNESLACDYSYNNTKDNDGIVVVGGTKKGGSRFVSTDGGYTGLPAPAVGSNYGACVELWAPGFNITSLDFFDGGKRVSTGTSFSAPFTVAVASRWGTNATRPIVREQLLKLHSVSVPGGAGKLVKYGTQYVNNASDLLPISKISAEGSSSDIPTLRNSKYYPISDMFVFPGLSGKLNIDLGSARIIKGARVTLITSANGNGVNAATFKLLGSNDGVNFSQIGSVTENRQANWAPIYIPGNSGSFRYLKIDGTNPLSYLGYSEVEVYGK